MSRPPWRSTGVPVTVLRAAMIIGSGSAWFEIMRYLVQRLPVMITPTWVSTRCQPIAIENVLGYLIGVLFSDETTGQVFDIGGPEILSYRDIMRIMAEELDLPRRWILPVPLLTPRLSSHWIQLVTPLSHRIARPLTEGLRNEVVCRNDRITVLIPQARLDVREAIHAALSQVKAHLVETHWSMAGPMPGDPDWSGGTVFRDVRQIAIELPSHTVFRAVCRVGGEHGWNTAGSGGSGAGSISGRVGPGCAGAGGIPISYATATPLDFWRVVGIERDRSLSLRAEMKLPGQALLDFRVAPDGDSSARSARPPSSSLGAWPDCSIGMPSCRFMASSFGRCSPVSSGTQSRSPPSQGFDRTSRGSMALPTRDMVSGPAIRRIRHQGRRRNRCLPTGPPPASRT